jgi:glucose-1-phosphate thymidylyltransferase
VEDAATITKSVGIGEGTIIHRHTAIRGPVVIGDRCEIGPNAYIGPYTSIGEHVTLLNTEIENSIIMNGAHIDCRRRIVDSLIGRNVKILSSEENIPRGHRLILGDMTEVTL